MGEQGGVGRGVGRSGEGGARAEGEDWAKNALAEQGPDTSIYSIYYIVLG